jgi:hypothetical protein
MKLIVLLILIVISKSLFAQSPESLLQKVQENYSPEKIYLHYDKSYYIAGETIWFKAYVLDGIVLSNKSTVIDIDLLDEKGKVIEKKIYPLINSTTAGNFELSKSLPQGKYFIKAFTKNLMNFGVQNFYYNQLHIYNPTTILINNKRNESTTFINFFPESGNMIARLKNKIALKCTDEFGSPFEVKGKIVDSNNKDVVSFSSKHDGMGFFEFIPKYGEQYTAECIINNGLKKIVKLPSVLNEGALLKIERKDNKVFFEINKQAIFGGNLQPSYLLGVQENIIVFKVPLDSSKGIIRGELPIADLLTGILQLTIFNKNNTPLAERLTFINSEYHILDGKLNIDTIGLLPRQKNVYSYNFNDTIAGTFSIVASGYNGEASNVDNLVSHFLLTNELKGKVFKPSYYFEANDNVHQDNLDLVMMTNGWRRYSWNQLFLNNFSSMTYKDPNFISLQTTIFEPNSKSILANADIGIFVKTKDNSFDYLQMKTNAQGKIEMEGLIFADTAKFTFKNTLNNNKKVKVDFSSPTISSLFKSPQSILPEFYFILPNEKEQKEITKTYYFNKRLNSNGILLDEVKVIAKKRTERAKYEKKYVTNIIGSNANSTLDFLADPPLTGALNILEYLKSRLMSVNITGGPVDYNINFRNRRNLTGQLEMNIFLDEVQVESNAAALIPVSDVALVKVFSTSLFAGVEGALAIYTKRDVSNSNILNNEQNATLVEGFSVVKDFFSPEYETGKDDDIKLDERSTLYWNPYITTSPANKNINFSFYNSDIAQKIRIIIEGVLANGKLVHIEKIIQ